MAAMIASFMEETSLSPFDRRSIISNRRKISSDDMIEPPSKSEHISLYVTKSRFATLLTTRGFVYYN